jgi:hypothetical protein
MKNMPFGGQLHKTIYMPFGKQCQTLKINELAGMGFPD